MKNRILSIVLAASILSLSGCGTANENNSGKSISSTSSDVGSSGNSTSSEITGNVNSGDVSDITTPEVFYGEIVGPDGFIPDYSQTHYTEDGYYIGHHFVENANEIYNNNGIYELSLIHI